MGVRVTTTDEVAMIRAILCDPADDTVRLAYADWLDENAGTVPCKRCEGRSAVGWDYVNGIGQPPKVYPCPECTQENYAPMPDGRSARAEFIRVQVELARLPPKPVVLGTGIAGMAVLRSAGPDYWTFSEGEDPRVKVGDRVDVLCHPAMLKGRDRKPKTLHGLVVTRIEDRGSDGIQYTVKRDANSQLWAGKKLAKHEQELLSQHWHSWSGRIATYCGNFHNDGAVGVTFSRGFVSAVTCTTTAFLGGECSACSGVGLVYYDSIDGHAVDGQTAGRACPTCHGTGSTTGLARELFERHPVEKITLSDLVLWINPDNPDETGWWDSPSVDGELGGVVPEPLFDLMWKNNPANQNHDDEGRWLLWDGPEVARDELSAACVQYGRALAGIHK